MRKPVLCICKRNKKGMHRSAALPPRLVSTFALRHLASRISFLNLNISSLFLASIAAQTGLGQTWSKTQKTGFLPTPFNTLYVQILKNSVNE